MALFYAFLLMATLGHTPLGWFGAIFLLGAWFGWKSGK